MWDQSVCGLAASPSRLSVNGFADLPIESRLHAWTGYSSDPAVPTLLRPPFVDNANMMVQEC